jgi:tetratricopeptide (TPR) repeat protein
MTRIILIMMIKNESKILQRSLNSSLPFVDGICILDTGSTDNTVELAETIISNEKLKRPDFIGKVYNNIFKNFGFNRSKSFDYTIELLTENNWDLSDTYGLLLDADMILNVVDKQRVINVLKNYDAMMIFQLDGTFKYYNIRFIKMCHDWECSGVTHEYWRCKNDDTIKHTAVLENDVIWIDDISDGGCKSDKIERDIRLIKDALESKNEPENESRYQFYLAQSYLSTNNYKKAIEHYSKHVEMGSFEESVWFATFMIGRSFLMLEEPEKAEILCRQAHSLLPNRSEPFFDLAKYYFLKGPEFYDKVEEYIDKGIDIPFPSKNLMYIDSMVYNFGFKLLKFKLMIWKKCSNHDLVCYYNEIGKTAKVNKTDISIDECIFQMATKIDAELIENTSLLKILKKTQVHMFNVCHYRHHYRVAFKNSENQQYINTELYCTDDTFEPLALTRPLDNVINIFTNNNKLYYVVNKNDTIKFMTAEDTRSVKLIEEDPGFISEIVKDTPFLKPFNRIYSVYESDKYFSLMEFRTSSNVCFIIVKCDSATGIIESHTAPFYFEKGIDEKCLSFVRHENNNFAIFYGIDKDIKILIVDFEKLVV